MITLLTLISMVTLIIRVPKRIFLTGILLLVSSIVPAQNQTRISGFIRDRQSGERLIGANILASGERTGTSSDNNGYFSLVGKVPCRLMISYVGYKPLELEINSRKDTLIDLSLDPGQELETVVVKGTRIPVNNVSTLKISELKQIPSLGGKSDVLKGMQLLPGIQAQNEGSSMLLVRGGDPGQNLYLFDNVPVIYVNHLGGFMSVFNPDIINSIDLYKGGFPARYGGRLSSIVDITQREGDRTSIKGSLGIGVTDISFSVEGPTRLRNSSFILTGRKTLTDPLMALFTTVSEINDFVVAYGFHDLNGKFTWKPDDRNSLHLNLYQGDDYMNFWSVHKSITGKENSHMGNVWGNWLASGRWNRVVSPRVFWSNILSYSRYRLDFSQSYSETDSIKHQIFDRNNLSSVADLSLRSNVKIQVLRAWSIETGLQGSYLNHIPNAHYQSNLNVQTEGDVLKAFESALYMDNKINLTDRIEANIGLRMVNYVTGGFTSFSFEPRARLGYQIIEDQFINASFQRVTQNEQLLFTSGSIMNNEVWVPAGNGILPARSDQYTFGWSGSFFNGRYTAELTGYYKNMKNLATYQEGYTSLMGDSDWRNKVVTGGTGRSAGIELFLKKQLGSWTGFVGYAYSRTYRQFDRINRGEEFVFDFDRPHTASLNISHQFNEKWSVNLVWVYQTGLPFTPVLGRQLTLNTNPDEHGNFGYYETLLYGDRNSARMKDYHRLDVGATMNVITRRNRKATWTFSIYNLYNRHNPYYYYFNTTANNVDYDHPRFMTDFRPTNLYLMSFFPIIPSVSYKVYFDGSTTERVKKLPSARMVDKRADLKNRWNIKAGYADIPGYTVRGAGIIEKSFGNFRLETNYRLFKFLDIGGYAGYSRYSARKRTDYWLITYEHTPFIGLNINLQLLRLFSNNQEPRFDLYLLGRYGGGYFTSPLHLSQQDRGFLLDYSQGAGVNLYVLKNFGVFAEFSFTGVALKEGNLRYGLSVRF